MAAGKEAARAEGALAGAGEAHLAGKAAYAEGACAEAAGETSSAADVVGADVGEEAARADEALAGAGDVADFCASLTLERNASAHTVRNYRNDLLDFLRWADREGVDPLEVTHKQLRRYLGELDRARYARSTVNRRLSVLRGFFRWLNVMGRIEADPACVLQGPKMPKSLPKVIKPADMARLLSVHAAFDLEGNAQPQSYVDMRDLALLELLYACGLRVSEASGLLAADVDLGLCQVKVMGKGSKERIVPVHELAVSALRAYGTLARGKILGGRSCAYFFVSTRGGQMSTDAIRKMFKSTLRAAGLDESLSPHAMRHTFATDLLTGGADLRSVQEMLGHASLSTTQIYTHVSPERLGAVHRQAHPRG